MNSSCRAPALSAIAFQPFLVGTVTWTRTAPLASRTGRITPGITDRISGLSASSRSKRSRRPSIMLCSTFSFPWAFRSRMKSLFVFGRRPLFESLFVHEIDAEHAVLFARRHGGPLLIQIPLHSENLLLRQRQRRYIRDRHVARDLRFHSQARLRRVLHSQHLRIDLDAADAEEPLQAA